MENVTAQEQVVNQFGRVHDVVIGPDGYLYITLQLPAEPVAVYARHDRAAGSGRAMTVLPGVTVRGGN